MKIANLEVKGVTCNSKAVKKGFVFVAITGNRQDGRIFIKEAICRGATLVVAQAGKPKPQIPKNIKLLTVKNCRNFLADTCAEFYAYPSDKIKVIGITGTNGKTTISYLIEAIAKRSGYACGVIGTINYRFKGKKIIAKNTTPGPGQLQDLLSKMHRRKVKYCAMEVSSHALDQERVRGINYRCAIFSNLTQDHLDYHKNLENYFLAKAKLFRALPSSGVAVINHDDRYGQRIKQLTSAKVITYGIDQESTVMAKDIDFNLNSTEFSLVAPKINIRIKTNLIGRHNVYNILAAISWGLSEKLKIKDIRSAVSKIKNVPGRLEKVDCSRGFSVFVDYAHTPDALFNVISAVRPLVAGKLIVIFGCGGERDKLKRPLMGEIASRLADQVIITSDNPRSEAPTKIIKDIEKGINKDNYRIICQRHQAIRAGLSLAKKGDCLIICGKGHESYQVIKDKILHFNDREAVEKCLKLMK